MPQARIKQIKGLESTLNALSGVTTIKETISTNAGSGATGFKLAYDAREVNGISVHVNGMKVETFSWIDGNGATLSTTLIPKDSELVWDSASAGYDLANSDIIEIIYETLAGGAIAFDPEGDYSDPGSGGTGPQGATGAQGAIGPQGPSGSGGSGNISGTVDGHLIPDTNVAYDLGNAEYKFRHLYLSGNTLYMGGQPLSIDNGQLTLNGNPVTGSTETPETIRDYFNNTGSGRTILPTEGPSSDNTNSYRLKDDYMNLSQGDEVFKIGFDPVGDGSTAFINSFNNLNSHIGVDGLSDNASRRIGTIMLHKETEETLTYKSGSLRGYFNEPAHQIDFEGPSDVENMNNSRIFVVGFENLDPTWPSTDPTQMPTIFGTYMQSVYNAPSVQKYVDQHIRAKLLDAYTLSGNYIHNSMNLISSDYIGSSNIDITNYVAISVFSHTPEGQHSMNGYVNYTILRS